MPRIARAVAVDFPHHIIQRGNNRQKVFFAVDTRRKYLDMLKDYAERWDISILAYCLMTNHIHLLVKPHEENSLAKMMQGVSQGYSKYINKRYKRTGRLWESRYYSCVVDEDSYLWQVARYIEKNPKRAGMVRQEEDYPYSSARAHVLDVPDKILGEQLFDKEEKNDYIEFLKEEPAEKEINTIRKATKIGRPLGDENFIIKIGKLLGRHFLKTAPAKQRK
ncbi:MAG: transposase [Planctomycetota bacterium]|nr:transposase [Planctomycetota bacterium]MDI6788009.1 transposase [Planctomycetota bacterium]